MDGAGLFGSMFVKWKVIVMQPVVRGRPPWLVELVR